MRFLFIQRFKFRLSSLKRRDIFRANLLNPLFFMNHSIAKGFFYGTGNTSVEGFF
jgi:hypothetical protein